jgi:hypothetical protein
MITPQARAMVASASRAKLSDRWDARVTTATNDSHSSSFQLCFRSLFQSGRGFAFPCDDKGKVSLDAMSERARNNYFYARAMVGRELAPPAVEDVHIKDA